MINVKFKFFTSTSPHCYQLALYLREWLPGRLQSKRARFNNTIAEIIFLLADRGKDGAVTTLAPAIAEIWLEQVNARDGWRDFCSEDFHRLKQGFRVTWVVIENRGVVNPPGGITCPYRNETVSVCRIE